MATALTQPQRELLQRVSDGCILYYSYTMGTAARIRDEFFADTRWSMAVMSRLVKAGYVQLPGRTARDRRATITPAGTEALS